MSNPILARSVAVIAIALGWPLPAAAFDGPDISCQSVRRTESGQFTWRSEPGLSVSALVAAPGPFVHDLGADVVAFSCLRAEPMPEVDEVEILQAGYTWNISGHRGGLRLVELSLAGGRVSYEMVIGTLSASERRRLDRIVAQMQARIAEAQP